jgi:hypothetical protein
MRKEAQKICQELSGIGPAGVPPTQSDRSSYLRMLLELSTSSAPTVGAFQLSNPSFSQIRARWTSIAFSTQPRIVAISALDCLGRPRATLRLRAVERLGLRAVRRVHVSWGELIRDQTPTKCDQAETTRTVRVLPLEPVLEGYSGSSPFSSHPSNTPVILPKEVRSWVLNFRQVPWQLGMFSVVELMHLSQPSPRQ